MKSGVVCSELPLATDTVPCSRWRCRRRQSIVIDTTSPLRLLHAGPKNAPAEPFKYSVFCGSLEVGTETLSQPAPLSRSLRSLLTDCRPAQHPTKLTLTPCPPRSPTDDHVRRSG